MSDTAAHVVSIMMERLALPVDARRFVLWEITRSGLQQLQCIYLALA